MTQAIETTLAYQFVREGVCDLKTYKFIITSFVYEVGWAGY